MEHRKWSIVICTRQRDRDREIVTVSLLAPMLRNNAPNGLTIIQFMGL
jgi:hypothetical protein